MKAWQGVAAAVTALAAGCTEQLLDLQFIPADEDFGAVAVGTGSMPRQLTLTNAGQEATAPLVVELTGDDRGEFVLSEDACRDQALTPGADCTVLATFAPTAKAVREATLEVHSGGSIGTANLHGTGVDPAVLILTPPADPRDFGPVLAGGTGQTTTFQVYNDGGVPGPALSVAISGADASMFVLGLDRCTGTALGPGESCTFAVSFRPPLSATGIHGANLQVTSSLGIGLTGNALHVASLAWSPPGHDYGPQQVTLDSASGDFTFQLTNAGNLDTSAVTLAISAGDFSIRTITCGTNGAFTLATGASCTVTIRFVASAAGTRGSLVQASASQGGNPPVFAAAGGTGRWLLQVGKSGAAQGTVTSSPAGITCDAAGTDCSELYDGGTTVTLTATPAGSARFTGWTGCTPVGGQPQQCTLALDGTGATGGAYSVTAAFDP